MYVHLGGDVVIPIRDIVAIFDARLLEQSAVNRALVEKASQERKLKGVGLGPECRTVIVASHGVYTSAVSGSTLARRMIYFRHAAIFSRTLNASLDAGFTR